MGICSPELHELKEMRRSGEGEPWAGHSPLGWVVFGDNRHAARTGDCTSAQLETKCNFVNLCTPADVGLDELLRRQYALDWSENCYTEALAMSKKDDRALSIAKESCVVVDGHYQIRLPWKDDVVKLSDNYSLAEQRLRRLGNRLIGDPETHKKYKEKIAQLIADGHAVENNDDSDCASKPDYFVPNHCTRPPAKF